MSHLITSAMATETEISMERALKRRCMELDIAEREARVTKLEIENVCETFNAIEKLGDGLDIEEEKLYKKTLLKVLIKGEIEMKEINIPDIIVELGYKFDQVDLYTIKIDVFHAWYEKNPGKTLQSVCKMMGGRKCYTDRYFECDRPILEKVIHEHYDDSDSD